MNGTAAQRVIKQAGRLPGASLLLALVAITLWFSPQLSSVCEWQREHPIEVWRWFTGHFCHWSAEHLAWDVIVFVVLGAMCERRNRWQFLLCLAASAVAITAATAAFLPNILSYRGLSGIDSALFGWLVAELFQEAREKCDRRKLALICLFGLAFIAKTALEGVTANTLFVSNARSEFLPVPLAHAVGALVGLALSAIRREPRALSCPFGAMEKTFWTR